MRALQDTLRADLVLTSSSFTPFSQEVATRTAAVDGVEAVSQFRQGGFKVNDSDAAMTGVDPGTIESGREPRPERRRDRVARFGRCAGLRPDDAGQRLGRGR